MSKKISEIKTELLIALSEFDKATKLKKGEILVVGCSTSEVMGDKIGTSGNEECAKIIFSTLKDFCDSKGIFLAAQCCEHLNRAIVIDEEAFLYHRMDNRVNVIPHKKAGGSFATAAYNGFCNPVVIERIKADAGIDIGDTFIGMHLKEVVVPVRVSLTKIGCAHMTLARTRYKFVGGERAIYNPGLN